MFEHEKLVKLVRRRRPLCDACCRLLGYRVNGRFGD